jgi:SAM-dependent methyltransferase
MNGTLLEILCCPACRAGLTLEDAVGESAIESGSLRCTGCHAGYPIRAGIPRFVPVDNYASTFGLQWNRFPRTQLDSQSGVPISRDRFFSTTGWTSAEMNGRRVLDVGCGSGRFAEVALGTGARLVAVDYSAAIDACAANLAGPDRDFVQADIYRLPFKDGTFDYVYCIGVLQHTPDPDRSFRSLLPPLRSRGKIAVDIYPKTWLNILWLKYWLRPITKRVPPPRLFAIVERVVPILLPVSRFLGRVPVVGRKLRWLVPVANYEGILPLNPEQIREWAILDTFDMLSPAHDHPRSARELRTWLETATLQNGEVFDAGHLVARAVKRPD